MKPKFLFRGPLLVKKDSSIKKLPKSSKGSTSLSRFGHELKDFSSFMNEYLKEKTFTYSSHFERSKNVVVKTVLIKRGKRNRVFLHAATMGVLTVGVILSPIISQADLFSGKPTSTFAQGTGQEALSLTQDDVFETKASNRPRDKIVTYTVQKGDTLSTIAKKFDISEDTVRWANDINGDKLTVGDQIQILPVSGVVHKVQKGDTVYSIADKYGINPQAIVDFPFNDFANPQTFSLVEGQLVIVPDGVMPQQSPGGGVSRPVTPRYVAVNPSQVFGSGFAWPIHGTMNQYFSWYHPALDLGDPIGTPVLAAQDGTVSTAITGGWNTGYGTHVIIRGNNGYSTLYAHMEAVNVSVGDTVVGGKTVIGWIGMTGRTTGPHLHFEIRGANGNVNPLSFLQ